MDEPGRNDVFERELRQALAAEGGAAAGPHVDAELAAAWMDRQLDAGTARSVEAHLAGCHDCQLLIATAARAALEAEAPAGVGWWQRIRAGWVVPAAAAAAIALVVWIAVPQQRAAPIALETAAPPAAPAAEAPAEQKAAATPDTSAKPASPVTPAPPPTTLEKRERFADAAAPVAAPKEIAEAQPPSVDARRADATTVTGQTPPAPQARLEADAAAAPPAGRVAALQGSLLRQNAARDAEPGALVIASPDGGRWRRAGGAVGFAPRADAAFDAVTLPAESATITAGASPGGTICWLVGRAGLVLVATDGVRFERVAVPAPGDLVAVVAADARTATVTAADGRRFRTTDRGASWAPLP